MENLSGRNLGGYELKELIRTGGMASIYKAYDKNLSRWMAIKVVRVNAIGRNKKTLLARFKQEAQVIAALRHRNILTIYDYGEEDGLAYFVMEYVSSGSLKDRIKPGEPFTWQRALTVIIPISQALAFAHKHGIIHRDIKPANILMTQDDWPLLADFGLAKMQHSGVLDLDKPGQVLGTMVYAAPEQVQEMAIDARADIYSLGIVLYELLTSRLPFQGKTSFDFLMAHLIDPPIPLLKANPDVPLIFGSIIDRALALNPNDRYQTMDEFSQALLEARYDLSSSFSSGTIPETSSKIKERITEIGDLDSETPIHQQAQWTVEESTTEIDDLDGGRNELIIGRKHKNFVPDIVLEDNTVSRTHARLIQRGEEWALEDLGSTNGTFLNWKKIASFQLITLKKGDKIRIGRTELTFLLELGEYAQELSQVFEIETKTSHLPFIEIDLAQTTGLFGINPYIAGPPITDPKMFFGREQILQKIINILHNNNIMLTGPRRIGKTSLLHQLAYHLPTLTDAEAQLIPALVNIEGAVEVEFFHLLMEEIINAVQPFLPSETAAALTFDLTNTTYPARAFSRDLQLILKSLQTTTPHSSRLVLLLDEMDTLNSYSLETQSQLRRIFQRFTNTNLSVVVAGVKLRQQWAGESSPFYNMFIPVTLTSFPEVEARRLITEPVQGRYTYQDEAMARILQATLGLPHRIQQLCLEVINHVLATAPERREITVADVDSVLQTIQWLDEAAVPHEQVISIPVASPMIAEEKAGYQPANSDSTGQEAE